MTLPETRDTPNLEMLPGTEHFACDSQIEMVDTRSDRDC